MNGKIKGYIFGAFSAASYGLNPTFTLPLYVAGLNPDSVLLLRYGLAILVSALMIAVSGKSFRVPGNCIIPLMVLGLLMAISSLTLFVSYKYMSAGVASTILFVYPIMVAVIMAVFYKEKLTVRTILCILLAAAGIFLLYNTGGGSVLSLVGTLMVIASALAYAIYLVFINQKKLSGIPTLVITFYVLLFGSSIFFVRMLSGTAELKLPGTWYLWLDLFGLVLFPTVISFMCTTRAIQLIGSTPTAILGALEPVTAVVMGIILFNEGMTWREAAGIFLILAAVSSVIAGGMIEQRMTGFLAHFRSR